MVAWDWDGMGKIYMDEVEVLGIDCFVRLDGWMEVEVSQWLREATTMIDGMYAMVVEKRRSVHRCEIWGSGGH